MFGHRIKQEALRKVTADDQLTDFIDLYSSFVRDADTDKVRMARFGARVGAAWRAIPREKRNAVAMALIERGALPDVVGEAIRVFKGEVISVL